MNLTHIAPFPGKGLLRIVVETPKGSRSKIDYDPKLKTFRVVKMLPEGMVFPYDFGFIPQTRGDDGDPLDALALLPESTTPGCVVDCRLIGVVRGKQKHKGEKPVQNDRFIAVSVTAPEFNHIKSPRDLHHGMVDQLQEFFVAYNAREGKIFKPLEVLDAPQALKLIKEARHKPER